MTYRLGQLTLLVSSILWVIPVIALTPVKNLPRGK